MTEAEIDQKLNELEKKYKDGKISLESYLRKLRDIVAEANAKRRVGGS